VAALPAIASGLVESSVKDAYEALKAIIRRQWGEASSVAKSVDALEAAPESKGQAVVLAERIEAVKATADAAVMHALAKLLDELEKAKISAETTVQTTTNISGGNFGIGVQYVFGTQKVGVPPSWLGAIRRYARPYDGLRLWRQAAQVGHRLRYPDGPPRPAIDRFEIGERVCLSLDLPEEFLDSEIFATVVHEALREAVCLFPMTEWDDGAIAGSSLRLPPKADTYLEVSGPPACNGSMWFSVGFDPTHRFIPDLTTSIFARTLISWRPNWRAP
jgi:hypothetical protein